MTLFLRIDDTDIPAEVQEVADASGEDASDLLESELEELAESHHAVLEGNTSQAAALAIHQFIQSYPTTDDDGMTTDSADRERTKNGGLDLRKHTK